MNVVKGRAAAVAHVASSAVGVISVIYQVSVASRRRGRLGSDASDSRRGRGHLSR